MTSLRGSGGSGDGGGSSNGSGGGRSSRSYGAVRWGVSGGGQLQLQRRQHDTLSPQQLREWYAHRSGGGGSSGSCCATVQLEVSSGGLAQLQRRPRETLTPQQLREWYTLHEVSRSSARCSSVIRTEFGDAAELPRWQELLSQGVDIFALYYDALLAVMYAVTIGTEGDCSLCVLPDPGIEAAALGASESALIGTAPAEALHTFTLDSVLARSSTVLPCPAVPSGSLSGLHLPSFSTNLVSTADLQDAMVTTTTPGDQRVSIRTCTRTGRHLATFTRQPGSSLYTLATEPPQVAASAQDEIHNVLIPWIRAVRLQLRERFRQDLPVLRLHSDRGGEFSSDLLRDFCRGEGILQSFALPASPQQNGIAERRIGLVMEVARTSMIHAAAPHFLWPFAVWYATLQLNLWPPGGTSAGGAGGGGAGAGDTGAVDPGAGGVGVGGAVSGGISARDIVRSRPYFVPLLPSSTGLPPRLPKRCEPESRLALPVRAVRTGRRVPCPLPPPVPGTHAMALRPSSVPLRVPVPAPPDSSLPAVPDPESDLACAACPTISRLLATVVTDPSFESTAASALVAELVDFAVACRLDYATALVAESDYASPSSIGGNCALGTDVLDNRQEDFECLAAAVPCFASMLLAPEGDPDAPDIPTPRSYIEAITSPYSSQWQATMDAEMASWKSTGTYVDAFPPSRANIVDGMWIFRVKRPPGSQPTFKARYVARGFSQRLRQQVYGLRQAPREWHDTVRTTLAALEFTPSTVEPSLFLCTDTSLPPFYVLVYIDDLVFATADTEALTLLKSKL
ncbi:unnamed protein product [Closterium sp. NIES-53]